MKWRLCAIYKLGTHRQTDVDTPWDPVGSKKYVSYIFFIAHYIPFLYLACSVVKWWWLSVKVSRTIIINIKPWNEQNNNETCPQFDCHMFVGAGVLWDWGAPSLCTPARLCHGIRPRRRGRSWQDRGSLPRVCHERQEELATISVQRWRSLWHFGGIFWRVSHCSSLWWMCFKSQCSWGSYFSQQANTAATTPVRVK